MGDSFLYSLCAVQEVVFMKLTFLGAARTVTGSCYLLEVNGKKMLVDCGMFQGSKSVKDFNEKPFALKG